MSNALWVKFENHALNEGLSENRIKKLKTMFNLISKYVDLAKADRPKLEKFIFKLNRNDLKRENGENYSGSTKADVKKFLRQFFKWYKGDNETYPKEVSWIKTRIPKEEIPKEKPIIDIKDLVKLSQRFSKPELQILTLLLFDSGFRIQEMQSCLKKDLTWEEFDDGESCWWIKCNKSKTYARKIPIPLFTSSINAWVNSTEFKAKGQNDPLVKFSYTKFLQNLGIYSKEIIGEKLSCHCLRHSSATYYAKEYAGNVPQLAQRFGWSFDAKELKTYVRMSGSFNKLGAKVSHQNKLTELTKKLDKQQEQIQTMAKLLFEQFGKRDNVKKEEISKDELEKIFKGA